MFCYNMGAMEHIKALKALFGGVRLGRHAASRKAASRKSGARSKSTASRDAASEDILAPRTGDSLREALSSPRMGKVLWISLAAASVIIAVALAAYLWPKSAPPGSSGTQTSSGAINESKIANDYARGDYKAVISNARKLPASDMGANLHEMLGTAYLMTGDNRHAADEYRAILKSKPNDADALYKIGVLLERTGRANEALGYLSRAVQAAPNVILFHTELARASAEAKSYSNAIDQWKTVLNLLPADDNKTRANTLAELANVYMMQNDLVQAKGIIATGLTLDPNNEALKALDAKTGQQIQAPPAKSRGLGNGN